MNRISGLRKYIETPKYREALGLPKEVAEAYEFLAMGEYNINYKFVHPQTEQSLVLRVNIQSQLHLENQISYESEALHQLEKSGRTPKVLYVDDSKNVIPYGISVMEFLPGTALDYNQDQQLRMAVEALADIHSSQVEKTHLICSNSALQEILDECEQMLSVYLNSEIAPQQKKDRLRYLLDRGQEIVKGVQEEIPYRCIINTELNSTNFLLTEDMCYVIDWEKPLYGDPAQDLGHFLAPTTTFWKTDVIFTQEQMEKILDTYCEAVEGRFSLTGLRERVRLFISITCLRGITWCAMAWVQYQSPDKMIANESTRKKLDDYLKDEFIDIIEDKIDFYTHF